MKQSSCRQVIASLLSPVCLAAAAAALATGATPAAYAGTGQRELTVLHTLTPDEGLDSRGTPTVGPDGAMYGVSYSGGDRPDATGDGTVWRQDTDGTFSVLHVFSGSDGSHPAAGLTLGPDGLLWGTTALGGATDRARSSRSTPAATTFCASRSTAGTAAT